VGIRKYAALNTPFYASETVAMYDHVGTYIYVVFTNERGKAAGEILCDTIYETKFQSIMDDDMNHRQNTRPKVFEKFKKFLRCSRVCTTNNTQFV